MTANLPYYSMYPKDFDADELVRVMTFAEKGFFVVLLNHAWVNDGLPAEDTKIARLAGAYPDEFTLLWPAVAPLFPIASDGRRRNARQEKERIVAIRKVDRIKNIHNSKNKVVNDTVLDTENAPVNDHVLGGHVSDSGYDSDSVSGFVVSEGGLGETADGKTVVGIWKRTIPGNPKQSDRRLIEAKAAELPLTIEEWERRISAYRQSEWAKEKGFPVLGFLKDPQGWEPPKPFGSGSRFVDSLLATTAIQTIAPVKHPTTVPELLAQTNNQAASEIVGIYIAIGLGPETTFPVVQAFLGMFLARTPEEQAAAAQNARMTLADRDPKYVKRLLKWWEGQPWTAANVPRQIPTAKDKPGDDTPEEKARRKEMARRIIAEREAQNGLQRVSQ